MCSTNTAEIGDQSGREGEQGSCGGEWQRSASIYLLIIVHGLGVFVGSEILAILELRTHRPPEVFE